MLLFLINKVSVPKRCPWHTGGLFHATY